MLSRVLLFTALLCALIVVGCGAKEEPGDGASSGTREDLRLVLDYFPNADHAGIYAAQASGEYDRAGLKVDIKAPPDPAAPLKLLRAGRADLVISYEPELLLARDKGAEIIDINMGCPVRKVTNGDAGSALMRDLGLATQLIEAIVKEVDAPVTLKMRMGATHFLMKTLPKVTTEMALHVLAYNLTRVMNIVGIKPFLAAIQA